MTQREREREREREKERKRERERERKRAFICIIYRESVCALMLIFRLCG